MCASVIGISLWLGILPAQTPPAVDAFGDPLPPGAVARLGSLRFLHGRGIERIIPSADGKIVATESGRQYKLWDAATGRQISLWKDLVDTPKPLWLVAVQSPNLAFPRTPGIGY